MKLRLCIVAILQGKFEELFTSFGVCCSSWIVTSRGSTGRCFICPMGNQAYPKVIASNVMVARTGWYPKKSSLKKDSFWCNDRFHPLHVEPPLASTAWSGQSFWFYWSTLCAGSLFLSNRGQVCFPDMTGSYGWFIFGKPLGLRHFVMFGIVWTNVFLKKHLWRFPDGFVWYSIIDGVPHK